MYGHYYNNNNHFICKKIVAKVIREEVSPLIIKNEELVRPYKGGICIAKDVNDLYDILDKLNTYKNENWKINVHWILLWWYVFIKTIRIREKGPVDIFFLILHWVGRYKCFNKR